MVFSTVPTPSDAPETDPEDPAHDPLIKQFLQTFLPEFMEGFYPDVAARLDFSAVQWLDKESFPDPPGGEVRIADLVAQVRTKDGEPEIVLLHIEPQRTRRKNFAERMFEYWFLLRRRHKAAVFPVALYLTPGAGGIVTEKYEVELFGKTQLTFEYHALGIPDLLEADYAGSDNPAVLAFRALMREHKRYSRAKPRDRVARVLGLLTAPAALRMDENRRTYLIALVEKYLPLTEPERGELERRLEGTGGKIVEQIMTYYERRGYDKGVTQGEARGEVKGIRRSILKLLEKRFGVVPSSVRDRVEAMSNLEELDAMLDQVSSAATLNDLGLAPA